MSRERTPLADTLLDIFPVFISLLHCSASVSVFCLFPFVKKVCSAFSSLCRSPFCHCLNIFAFVSDIDPWFSNFVFRSSKSGKIIAACIMKVFSMFSFRRFEFLFRVSLKL